MSRSIFFLKIALFSIVFLTVPGAVGSYAQSNKIDSLSGLLKHHPKQDDIRAEILLNLASASMKISPKSALPYLNEILSFPTKIKDKKYLATAHRTKGIAFFYLAMYPEALESLNSALLVENSIGNQSGIAAALSNIGLIHMTQSKFPTALKYYLDALKKYEKLKDSLSVAKTLLNMGIVYNEMGNYREAMKNYQSSLTIFTKHNYALGRATVLTNIGIIHYKSSNFNEAIAYSKLSMTIADSIGDVRTSARENGNLAAYYCELNQPDAALMYGFKAMKSNEKSANKKGLGYNLQNISDAYYLKHEYELAKSYALNALEIGNQLDIKELRRDASLGLSEIYGALKKMDSTFFYYKQYKELGDSISNDERKNEITRMGMQYEFDKTEAVYRQKQILSEGKLKEQQLQLALNRTELQRGLQQTQLQKVLLENEKLISSEKEKLLLISKNNEKLQSSKLNLLSQEQKLYKLEIRQLWLYGILAIVMLLSVLIYLLNLHRIRKLKFENTLRLQKSEQNALKLQHQFQLSESELRAIRSQMNPHFIFNVLNSIESYIMDNDKRTASRLIQKFASLSRLILENSIKSLIPADREWKALQLYTELEAMRYNNSFTYSFDHARDISLSTIQLPPMLIQPLIENAILHGIIGSGITDAHIAVTMQRSDQTIVITVKDNGIGLHGKTSKTVINTVKEKSIGLKSIKERIRLINAQYHSSASFAVEEGPDHRGTLAVISLPLLGADSAETY